MDKTEITFVIQGEIQPEINLNIAAIKQLFPTSPVIVSTCNPIAYHISKADKIIQNPDPGFFYYSKRKGERANNINRQIVSTSAGLTAVETPYVMKLRSDFLLTGSSFLRYFDTQPCFDEKYRIFEHKVLACCYCTRNPSVSLYPFPFHPADIALFGLTDDVRKLFDIPLMTEDDAYWDADHDYFNRYVPEQHIFINCLKKQNKVVECSCYKDNSPTNIRETENYFVSNFIFLNYKNFNLKPKKTIFYAKNNIFSFASCYTQIETTKMYSKILNDTVRLPIIDRERFYIRLCLFSKWLAKIIARIVFYMVPVQKIRKKWRPRLALLLYKIFTCFL